MRNNTQQCRFYYEHAISFLFYSYFYYTRVLILFVKRTFVDKELNEHGIGICDRNIDINKIVHALKGMANKKSPGFDGLTVEFYDFILPQLKNILYKLYLEIENREEMSHSMKMGIITLICKKKGDKGSLKKETFKSFECWLKNHSKNNVK